MEKYTELVTKNPYVLQLIMVVVGVIFILTVKNLIRSRLIRHIKDNNNSYRSKKAINAVGYFLILLLISIIYRESLGTLAVFFGIVGAGIAFALQEVIVSIAGWISILLTDIYKTGDRVMLGGIKGDVIDVGVLRTTIMEIGGWVEADLYNGRIVRIANSFVFKEPVYNYSADFPFLWDEIKVPIQYGSNYTLARKIIFDVGQEVVGEYSVEAEKQWEIMLKKFMIENASTHPTVTIIANDNWVEFSLRYVVDYKKRVGVKDQLFTKILEQVEASSNQVELASTTIALTKIPPLEMKL
ncbi:mechanosensitive ion channel family protein [Acetobacterium sp.]|jgi:small-conductance mechanosensitive channel|uniref:mechanosensitive ion channel family protein n=1 Tax=Acetobacterium sp. TaxID=1872094 RepID=UPI0027289796|nr:mechanosensitive ion channel domain-containing protein [Acetobacterium sp.]MDO9494019.1 mechanosensitive ion channel [Acetobacterium sp.]